MFCPNCGAQCEDDEVFCSTCGASLAAETAAPAASDAPDAPDAPAAPVQVAPDPDPAPARTHGKKSVSPKLVGLIAIIAVVLIVIFVATKLFGGGGGGKRGDYVKLCDGPIFIGDINDDGEYPVIAGIKQVGALESYSDNRYSSDGSAFVMTTDAGDGDSTLLHLSGKGVEEVAEDVLSHLLSADGTGIAYTTTDDELYLYDTAKGKGQLIAEDITELFSLVISPDGNTVAYKASIDEDEAELYLCVNGKEPTVCSKTISPLSVTNDGSLIYGCLYRQDSVSLYAIKGEKDEKLASDFDRSYYLFNQDGTEILFYSSGKTYYSKNGGEKAKVSNDSISNICLPKDGGWPADLHLPVSSLLNQVYMLNSGDSRYLHMVKGALETTKIDGNDVTMASGCGKLLSIKSGDLVLTEKLGANPKTTPLTDDASVLDFCADSSLTHIYYVDSEYTLYYQKDSGKAKKIADDISGNSLMMGADGTAYFTIDGALYTSAKGSAKAAVKGGGADDVWHCFIRGAYVYYYDTDGGLYGATSGGKFEELS